MLLHTHARFVVDFESKTVYATAKLWVKPRTGSNSVSLNLRSNVELLSVTVNGSAVPFTHDDLLRHPSVFVNESLLSLDSYNAVYRVATSKTRTGELEIDLTGCSAAASTVPTGESSSPTLPSGASVVGAFVVELLYQFSPSGLDAVGFHDAPLALRGVNRAAHNSYFLACGGSSVVGGVDANGGCGVSTWLPCVDSHLPNARSTYDLDIALLHGKLNTCVNESSSTPGGDEASVIATQPLTVIASGDYVCEVPATLSLPRPSGGLSACPLYFQRFRVAVPIHAHALAFAIGAFARIPVTSPLSGGAVGVTCSVYGPEWLSSVLAPVVRDLNAVVHDLHISLGTAPRFNVHHSVFLPLPLGLQSVSSHGLSFVPLARVLSCVVTPEDVPHLQRVVCQALVLSWIQSYLTVSHWADAWILMGLAGSMALTSIEHRFGPGELEYHVYSQQQELLKLEDTYPHLLCLRPVEPVSIDTLSSQHPYYQTYLRLKAPLVWYMLTGWVGKDVMKPAVLALLAAAAGSTDSLSDVSRPPPLSREESDGLASPSASASVISSYAAALASVYTDGISTDSLLTIVSGETVTETGEIARVFLADWVYGTGYPRFRAHVSFNRKHNRADFRIEQSIREAGKLFRGGMAFRLFEFSDRVVDKRNNKVDKAKSTFPFPLTEKARARGPVRQQMGRARDRETSKFAVTAEALKEDQAAVVNKAHVDDDGVLENDLSLKYFRIDPEYLWIKRIEIRGSQAQIETMATAQLRCDMNTMSQLEAVSLLHQVDIDVDDARRALSVIRTLKRCVHNPELHYRVRAAACNTLAKWQSRHSPRVNVPVGPDQSWHGLSTLILAYKERYCDEASMPKPFTITSSADQVLRRALVTAMSRCRHSCGTVPLPAIGFLLKLLSYHDAGAAFDDSAFLADLIEAVQFAAMHATPSTGSYDCNLTFLEEERRAFVASDKSLYVLLPSSEASGVSHSSGAWLGVSGVGNTVLGPYDDPRSTAQPLKAINPYDKSQVQNAALLEERRRAQIVDPRECAVLMGVSQRSPGPIKGATLVTMAVQSIQRILMLRALAFQPGATAVEQGFGATSSAHVIVTALKCLSDLYSKFPSTNDASIDFLSFCGLHFPVDVRVASVSAFCKVFVERTPWDSASHRFGGGEEGDDVFDDGPVLPTASASTADVTAKGEQWMCNLLRVISIIAEDGDSIFQRDAVRAVLAMQWSNCSAKQRWLRDKLGLLSEITVEELTPRSVLSEQPSTRSTLRVLLPSARIDALRRHVGTHTHPSSGECVHSAKHAHPAVVLWHLMNEGSAFQWDLRRSLFHLYHSIWGASSPSQIPHELPDKRFALDSIPFMPALQTLIRETREVTDHRLNVAAYQLVALVRKEVSDDEVDEKEKRRAAVEERANRMLEKDFFKEYNPRVVLRRLPNGYIPKALYIKQLNAEKLATAHTIKIKHKASGVETDASQKKIGMKGTRPVPELGLGGGNVHFAVLPSPVRPPIVPGSADGKAAVSMPAPPQPSSSVQPITSPGFSLKLTVPQQPTSAGVVRLSLPKKQ